jgi:hypothetical protein
VPSEGYRRNVIHFVNGQGGKREKEKEGKGVKDKDMKEIIPLEYQWRSPLVCYQGNILRKKRLFKQNGHVKV